MITEENGSNWFWFGRLFDQIKETTCALNPRQQQTEMKFRGHGF